MEQEGSGFIQLLPLVLMTVPLGILTILLAKSKGRSAFWWKIIGFVPLIGWYPILYLIGITDKAVYDKLDEISEALERRFQ